MAGKLMLTIEESRVAMKTPTATMPSTSHWLGAASDRSVITRIVYYNCPAARSRSLKAQTNASESHAIGVVGHRRGPIGEDAADADVLGENVERLVHVAVLLDRDALRVEIVVEACARGAPAQVGALERPGDDLEPGMPDVARVLRRHHV